MPAAAARESAVRATSCMAARAPGLEEKMGRRQTVFVLGTFYWHHVRLLQKNLAHTLGRRPLEGSSVKQATVQGVGGGPARKRGLGGSTGESGGRGRCAHGGRHTPRGAPSRTKVPSLGQVWEASSPSWMWMRI